MGDVLNHMTGIISSRGMGIGAGQRGIESVFAAFAPQYIRAVSAVAVDALQGGIRGSEARKSLAALALGGTAMYVGVAKALGQEPNLDPSTLFEGVAPGQNRFYSIRVGNADVGIGGAQYALFRLLAGVIEKADSDPADLLNFNIFDRDSADNPILNFWRSRAAIATGLAWDLVSGANYQGQPTRQNWEQVLGTVGRRFLPFLVESMFTETPQPDLVTLPSQFYGLRVNPRTLAMARDDLRSQYSDGRWFQVDAQGKAAMSIGEKNELRLRHPDLVAVEKMTQDYYGGLVGNEVQQQTSDYYDDRKSFGQQREARLKPTVSRFLSSPVGENGEDLRHAFQDWARESAHARELTAEKYPLATVDIDAANQYRISQGRQPIATHPWDDVARQYFDIPIPLDENGEEDFTTWFARRDAFLAQLPSSVVNYLQNEALGEMFEDPAMNRAFKQYHQDIRDLQGYWAVRDDLSMQNARWRAAQDKVRGLKQGTPEYQAAVSSPDYKRFQAAYQQAQEDYLRSNPEMEKKLLTWYKGRKTTREKDEAAVREAQSGLRDAELRLGAARTDAERGAAAASMRDWQDKVTRLGDIVENPQLALTPTPVPTWNEGRTGWTLPTDAQINELLSIKVLGSSFPKLSLVEQSEIARYQQGLRELADSNGLRLENLLRDSMDEYGTLQYLDALMRIRPFRKAATPTPTPPVAGVPTPVPFGTPEPAGVR